MAICFVCFWPATLSAQPRGNRLLPRYVTVERPDQAEGARILAEFRQLGLPGDYYLDVVLEVLPRRGTRTEVPGHLWGGRIPEGAVSRLELQVPPQGDRPPIQRLLVHSGPLAQAWMWPGSSGDVEELGVGELLDPLAGSQATIFDLQMPFVHWRDFVFEGVTRVRGRTAHAILLYPPEEFRAAYPHIGGVRVHLDLQFHALMQAVVLDAAEQPLRTLTVIDLKKVQDQWIVKTIDVRDERSRDKTRFRVRGAALGLEFAGGLFEPGALDDVVPPPTNIERFD